MMMTSLSVGGEMSTSGRVDNRSRLSPFTLVEDCTETLSKGLDGHKTHTLSKGIDTKREKSFPDSASYSTSVFSYPCIVPVPVYICSNRSYMPTFLLHTSIPIL